MIRVADYIVDKLADYGIKDIFMISGGGAIFLNDAIGRHKGMSYICNQHEQASSIAAEGYSRSTGKLAVVCVTTGPGGTNTITGVIGQWLDSVPVLYISGQVKYETTIESCKELGLRQLGDQEINIVDIVKPITKYAKMIIEPEEIKVELDKAIKIALEGRPGPAWLDIPINVQSALISEESIELVSDSINPNQQIKETILENKMEEALNAIKNAKRPILVGGNGIRISGAAEEFNTFARLSHMPVVSSFNGFDLIETKDELFIGRLGTIGDRAGNIAVQNADFVLFIGTRNNIRQTGYNWNDFAPKAKKVVVDIDIAELNKPTMKPNLSIQCDAKEFLNKLMCQIKTIDIPDWSTWHSWCKEKKYKYPVVLEEYRGEDKEINPYYFVEQLSKQLDEGQIIITGNGTGSVCYFQAGIVKKNQRVIWNSGCASMGYDLPAAIGAAVANKGKSIVCLAGDGSLQMNIQELETLKYYNLPVKLFILNNSGYISIKQTQNNLFEGFKVACDPEHGVGIPNFLKIAEAYELKTETINTVKDFSKIQDILKYEGPIICEIKLATDYIFAPKSSSEKLPDGRMVSKALDDMYPFLDRGEYLSNIIK